MESKPQCQSTGFINFINNLGIELGEVADEMPKRNIKRQGWRNIKREGWKYGPLYAAYMQQDGFIISKKNRPLEDDYDNNIPVPPVFKENRTVFFKNLPIDQSHKPIQQYIQHLTGEVTNPNIYKDQNGYSLGMGNIEFSDISSVNTLLQHDVREINGAKIQFCQHESREDREKNKSLCDIFVNGIPPFIRKDRAAELLGQHLEISIKRIDLRTKGQTKLAFIQCEHRDLGKYFLGSDSDGPQTLRFTVGDYLSFQIRIQKYRRPPAMRKKGAGAVQPF